MRSVRVYAHRGASAEAPENTLEAFRRAIARGADALEMDAHATQDGAVVISHDPDGTRAAGVPRRICESSLAEVRGWDAGFGFVAGGGGGALGRRGLRLPLLEEVLEVFPGVPLNIDLKAPIAEAAVWRVRRHLAEDRVCLASFEAGTMRRVRAL